MNVNLSCMDVFKPNKYKIILSLVGAIIYFLFSNYLIYIHYNQCLWIVNQDPGTFRGTPTDLCGVLPFNNIPFSEPTLYGYIEILWAVFNFCWIYLIYSLVQKRNQQAKMKLKPIRKKVRHK